jgi:hypothetical protein
VQKQTHSARAAGHPRRAPSLAAKPAAGPPQVELQEQTHPARTMTGTDARQAVVSRRRCRFVGLITCDQPEMLNNAQRPRGGTSVAKQAQHVELSTQPIPIAGGATHGNE